jgi:hypothetical protein
MRRRTTLRYSLNEELSSSECFSQISAWILYLRGRIRRGEDFPAATSRAGWGVEIEGTK